MGGGIKEKRVGYRQTDRVLYREALPLKITQKQNKKIFLLRYVDSFLRELSTLLKRDNLFLFALLQNYV